MEVFVVTHTNTYDVTDVIAVCSSTLAAAAAAERIASSNNHTWQGDWKQFEWDDSYDYRYTNGSGLYEINCWEVT